MIFAPNEIEFIKRNKPVIQTILVKKLEDVLNDIIYEKDEDRVKVLRIWAKELKELNIALDNIMKAKSEKKKEKDTGI